MWILLRLLALLGLLSAAALLQACASAGRIQGLPGPDDRTLYVVRRGWHIDIGMDAAELPASLSMLRERFPQARTMLFGFGDRRYLESRRHGASSLLAALWPGEGLILVTALDSTPEQAFGRPQVVTFAVDPASLHSARERISASIRAVEPPAGEGPYAGSLYLSSTLGYSALHTCNTWAAETLQAAGLPVRSHGVLLASQLWAQVQHIAGAPRPTCATARCQ